MSRTFEAIQFGSDTTITVTFTSDGSTAVDIGSSPTTLNIVWTSDDPDASTITTTGSVVGDGSGGQATFTLSASAYSSLTAPVRLYGVPKVVTSGGVNYIGDSVVLPIAKADYPNTTGLCTLARLKQYLKVQNDNNDDILTFYIKAATERIELMTGRSEGGFVNGTFTEDFDGSDTDTYVVRNPPIESITSLNSMAQDGTLTVIDSTTYRHTSTTGEIRLDGSARGLVRARRGDVGLEFGHSSFFDEGFKNFRVVYVGGYDPDEIPFGLQQACLELAADFQRQSEGDPRMQSESLGDYSYTRAASDEVMGRVNALVNQYRRITL